MPVRVNSADSNQVAPNKQSDQGYSVCLLIYKLCPSWKTPSEEMQSALDISKSKFIPNY